MVTPHVVETMHKYLDAIEKDPEAKLMVTISTSNRFFCTGFDLKIFSGVPTVSQTMVVAFCKVYARILTMNLPTLAITHGHTIAAGWFLASVHDRIISLDGSSKTFWQLSETALGATMGEGFSDMMLNLMKPRDSRKTLWAGKFTPKQMVDLEVVDHLF